MPKVDEYNVLASSFEKLYPIKMLEG